MTILFDFALRFCARVLFLAPFVFFVVALFLFEVLAPLFFLASPLLLFPRALYFFALLVFLFPGAKVRFILINKRHQLADVFVLNIGAWVGLDGNAMTFGNRQNVLAFEPGSFR